MRSFWGSTPASTLVSEHSPNSIEKHLCVLSRTLKENTLAQCLTPKPFIRLACEFAKTKFLLHDANHRTTSASCSAQIDDDGGRGPRFSSGNAAAFQNQSDTAASWSLSSWISSSPASCRMHFSRRVAACVNRLLHWARQPHSGPRTLFFTIVFPLSSFRLCPCSLACFATLHAQFSGVAILRRPENGSAITRCEIEGVLRSAPHKNVERVL